MIELPTAEHGEFTSASLPPYAEGTEASLRCDPGYAHDLSTSTLFLRQGQLVWDPPSATCVPLPDQLPDVHQGHFIQPQFPPYKPHSKHPFECNPPYWSPVTEATVVWSPDEWIWNPRSAHCRPVLRSLPDAVHGHFQSVKRGPFPEGSEAQLVCDPGYAVPQAIVSKVSTNTQQQLQWIPGSATCAPVLMDLPPADHGYYTQSPGPYFEGTVATLECPPGFLTDVPQSTAVLQPDGTLQWHPPSGTCFPVLDTLPDAEKGEFKYKNPGPYREGAIAYLECQLGYTANGPTLSTLTKQASGHLAWNPPSVTCVPIACDPPPFLAHGRIDGHLYTFPHKIEFRCKRGYTLNAPLRNYFCSANGEWTPKIPPHLACDPIQCPPLDEIDYGLLKCPDRTVDSIARYTCFDGFRMTGQPERVCQDDGTWSGVDVTCHPFQPCTRLAEMVQVKTESPSSIVLDCGNGREDTIMCLGNGQWSKPPPYCQGMDPQVNPFDGGNDEVEIIPVVPAKPKVTYRRAVPVAPKPQWKIHWIVWVVALLFCLLLIGLWSQRRHRVVII